MNNDYYVYIYLDPRKPGKYIYENLKFDYEPFYVGKGKGNRIYQGFDDSNNNLSKKDIIKNIRKIGIEPIAIKIYEKLSENMSYELEKSTIKIIGREKENSILVNRAKGSTKYKQTIVSYNSKYDKNLIVNLIAIFTDYYLLQDGSYCHKDLFFSIFEKIY